MVGVLALHDQFLAWSSLMKVEKTEACRFVETIQVEASKLERGSIACSPSKLLACFRGRGVSDAALATGDALHMLSLQLVHKNFAAVRHIHT